MKCCRECFEKYFCLHFFFLQPYFFFSFSTFFGGYWILVHRCPSPVEACSSTEKRKWRIRPLIGWREIRHAVPPDASVTVVRERVWGLHYRRIVCSAPLPLPPPPPRPGPLPSPPPSTSPRTTPVGSKRRPICVSLELQASNLGNSMADFLSANQRADTIFAFLCGTTGL